MKKILILCIAVLVLFTGCGTRNSINGAGKQPAFQQISMKEGLERMESDTDYILLDVRRIDEFEAGHIPGAINVPNESIGTEEIAQLPDKNQNIYVYCRSGNRSKQASRKLAELGYINIIEIGGIIDYSGAIETGRQ